MLDVFLIWENKKMNNAFKSKYQNNLIGDVSYAIFNPASRFHTWPLSKGFLALNVYRELGNLYRSFNLELHTWKMTRDRKIY